MPSILKRYSVDVKILPVSEKSDKKVGERIISLIVALEKEMDKYDPSTVFGFSSAEESYQSVEECLSGKKALGLFLDDEMVGIACYDYNKERGKLYGFISALYVESNHRGKGYGTMLINAVKKELRNADTILISVFDKNVNAKKLYTKLNFKPFMSTLAFKNK